MNDMEIKDKEPVGAGSMKTSTKVALWLLGIGVVLFLIGALWFNMELNKIKDMKDTLVPTKSISEVFDAEKVKNITIDVSALDLKIEKSGDKKVHVVGEKVPESLEVNTDGNTLTIVSKKKKWNGIKEFALSIIEWNETDELTVQLPEKEYDIFTLELGAGDINISNVKCRALSLEMGAGDIDASDIDCVDFEADISAGDMNFSRVNCISADVDMSAGDFDIENMTCETADFDSSAGDIKINTINCKDKLIVDNSAGDAKIINAVSGGFEGDSSAGQIYYSGTINGNITVDSSAGDVELKLTNPESDFNKNGGKYTIKVDCSAGDKTIEYNCK